MFRFYKKRKISAPADSTTSQQTVNTKQSTKRYPGFFRAYITPLHIADTSYTNAAGETRQQLRIRCKLGRERPSETTIIVGQGALKVFKPALIIGKTIEVVCLWKSAYAQGSEKADAKTGAYLKAVRLIEPTKMEIGK